MSGTTKTRRERYEDAEVAAGGTLPTDLEKGTWNNLWDRLFRRVPDRQVRLGIAIVMIILLLFMTAFLTVFLADDDADTDAAAEDPASAAIDQEVDEAADPDGASEAAGEGELLTVDSASVAERVGSAPVCLERRAGGTPPTLHDACADQTGLEAVIDTGAMTIAGGIDLELACPGATGCSTGRTTAGTVVGDFPPMAFGRYPDEVPADFPFPDHHWYAADTDHWWAGGPIELEVAMAGSYTIGETEITVDDAATLTGWAEATLWPAAVTGGVPTDWNSDLTIRLDPPEEDDPNWWVVSSYSGYPLGDVELDLPPWAE